MSSALTFGLVNIKGKPEKFQRLAKLWLERDNEIADLRFFLKQGGEDWLYNSLLTGPSHGINPSSVEERVVRFGSNRRKKLKPISWWNLLFDALKDFTLVLLMVCAVVLIAVNLVFAPAEERSMAWIEGFAILVAVAICSIVTATNDFEKAKKFRELYETEQGKKQVEVMRGGKRLSLNPEDIVVGDLILLQSGMEIQGDGVLIEANEVEIDESSMTGESEPQRKDIFRRCLIEKEKILQRLARDAEHSIPSPVVLAGTKVRIELN